MFVISLTFLILLLTTVTWVPCQSSKIVVYHNSDLKGEFEDVITRYCRTDISKCPGGFSRMATVLKNAPDGKLYFNLGNTFGTTSLFRLFTKEISSDLMNMLKPDVISLGKQDFRFGISVLNEYMTLTKTNFICSTVNTEKVNKGKYSALGNLKKSTVLNVGGTKIGVLSYMSSTLPDYIVDIGINVQPELPIVKEECEKLKANGAKIVIALGQSGLKMDLAIAAKVECIDVIFGSNPTAFHYNGNPPAPLKIGGAYPIWVRQNSEKSLPIFMTGPYGLFMGNAELELSENGSIQSANGEPIYLKHDMPKDHTVNVALTKFVGMQRELLKLKVGCTRVNLDVYMCEEKECIVGNSVADAYIYKLAKHHKGDGWTDVAISLLTASNQRISIDKGVITTGHIFSLLMFDNEIAVAEIQGKHIKRVLEDIVKKDTASRYFLQVSGLRIVYNKNKPDGKRVISVEARCANCNEPIYRPVSDNKFYTVASTHFLFKGMDGIFPIFKTYFKNIKLTGFREINVFTEYIHMKRVFYAEENNRITVISFAHVQYTSKQITLFMIILNKILT